MPKTLQRALLAAAVAALAAPTALAQLESPLLSKVQVNIVNPGGKSLAMGGAFVSVADDATAAIANPAGLVQLSAWQLGASGKYFKFEPKLDTGNFIQSGDSTTLDSTDLYRPSDNATELEYASLVIPVTSSLTMAVFRNINMRYQFDGNKLAKDLPGGNYRAFFINRNISNGVTLDEEGGLDLRNEQYGVSAGGRFGAFSLGAGITLNKLRYNLTGGPNDDRHLFISNEPNIQNPTSADPYFVTDVTATVDSGTKVGWLVGVRYTLDEAHNVAIGGVYRNNPEYDMNYHIHAVNAAGGTLADFSCGVDDPNVAGSGASACGTFRVPDDYSFGISGRPFPALLVAFEVQRIRYSQLNDGFVPVFAYRYPFPANDMRAISQGNSDDGTLPRVGLEYTVRIPNGELNLRAGYYHEPAHGTKLPLFADDNPPDRQPDSSTPVEAQPFSEAYRISFNGGEAENHYSFGLGATFSRRFSVDAAFDYSETNKSAVVSAFVRF